MSDKKEKQEIDYLSVEVIALFAAFCIKHDLSVNRILAILIYILLHEQPREDVADFLRSHANQVESGLYKVTEKSIEEVLKDINEGKF